MYILRNAFQNPAAVGRRERAEKLNGASELHRFNRDVEDAISRIQEKYASIPEDLGRDLKAVQSYMKKHENFETELAALEGQVLKHCLSTNIAFTFFTVYFICKCICYLFCTLIYFNCCLYAFLVT